MQFGDGIMSMIDCKIDVSKKPDPKGDRVVLTFEYVFPPNSILQMNLSPVYSGKFLSYAKW